MMDRQEVWVQLDEKAKKDAQETLHKLLDQCILIAGRASEQTMWIRKATVADDRSFVINDLMDVYSIEDGTPAPQVASEEVSKKTVQMRDEDFVIQVTRMLTVRHIPKLVPLLEDQERISALLTNAMHYIVLPNLKNRHSAATSALVMADLALDMVLCMSRTMFSYRPWRKDLWDTFLSDQRFFHVTSAHMEKWKLLLPIMVKAEPERVEEILGRITVTQNTNIFLSKDQEVYNRTVMLRRLSLILMCGTVDQYAKHFPNIQEKINELLKIGHPRAYVEVYLCLRVLLCRMIHSRVAQLSAIVFTEMVRRLPAFNLKRSSPNCFKSYTASKTRQRNRRTKHGFIFRPANSWTCLPVWERKSSRCTNGCSLQILWTSS